MNLNKIKIFKRNGSMFIGFSIKPTHAKPGFKSLHVNKHRLDETENATILQLKEDNDEKQDCITALKKRICHL